MQDCSAPSSSEVIGLFKRRIHLKCRLFANIFCLRNLEFATAAQARTPPSFASRKRREVNSSLGDSNAHFQIPACQYKTKKNCILFSLTRRRLITETIRSWWSTLSCPGRRMNTSIRDWRCFSFSTDRQGWETGRQGN